MCAAMMELTIPVTVTVTSLAYKSSNHTKLHNYCLTPIIIIIMIIMDIYRVLSQVSLGGLQYKLNTQLYAHTDTHTDTHTADTDIGDTTVTHTHTLLTHTHRHTPTPAH